MGRFQRQKSRRVRVGLVSYYYHHGSWYLYYRQDGRQIRQRLDGDEHNTAMAAARLNSELLGVPLMPTVPPATAPIATTTPAEFQPITVAELRSAFLDHHEHVLNSSLATVARYRTATRYLEAFTAGKAMAHAVNGESFLRHLRTLRVAPNGHPHSARRPLRDKGIRYILEVGRGMYRFAAKRRHLPPYAENPFSELTSKRIRIENAKSIFVFDQHSELAFLQAADRWSFPVHLLLAKTGLRPGELVHLLIEDIDFAAGWLHVRNKPDLGWCIKSGRDRRIPLVSEIIAMLRRIVGNRTAGLLICRPKWRPPPTSPMNRRAAALQLQQLVSQHERQLGRSLSRREEARLARALWHDAGMVKPDYIRKTFIRIAELCRLPDVTCPKSWRHTFATLLQDANVDPLLRQITLGHSPPLSATCALGMSGVYSHSRPQTQKVEIERAMRLWPSSLQLAAEWAALPEK